MTFRDALISEVTIPALDTSSQDTVFFEINIRPSQFTWSASNRGQTVPAQPQPPQKRWVAANFRLDIDGLGDTSRVTRIDPIAVKLISPTDSLGNPMLGVPPLLD
jgi:hypothetical protein